MNASRLDVLLAETGLDPADQQALVALEEMLALVPDEAPRPSAELQAVLADGPSIPRRPGHPLRTGVVAGVIGLAATVGIGGVAAAANQLPPGMQRVVSQWSHRHLPFTFPMPERSPHAVSVPRHPTPSATAPSAPHVPSLSAVPGGRAGDAGATPAARPDARGSAAGDVGTPGRVHAGGSSPGPSKAGSASRPAGDHGQGSGSAGRDRGAAASKHEHPHHRPTGLPSAVPSAVPSAESKRQDTVHRPAEEGKSSGHRRSVRAQGSAPRVTQSGRDRRPGDG